MSGITKTIPQAEGPQALEQLYDGSITEFEFHMAGTPRRLVVGQYVYTIWQDQLVGRCEIVRLHSGVANLKGGRPQTLIFVSCPGERLAQPIERQGHRGTRYYEGEDWPEG